MLKYLPRSGIDFLLHIVILSWICIPFLPSGRHLLLFSSTKRESLSTLLLSSSLYLLPPAYQSFLNPLYYPVYSFWSLIPFSLPFRPVSALDCLLYFIFLNPSQMVITNPGRALGRFSPLIISLKLLTQSGIPPFFTNSFRLASLLALLVGLNLSFLTGALRGLSKSQKSFLWSPSRCSARIRSWPYVFLSLHQ